MSITDAVINPVLSLHGAAAYATIGGLVGAEAGAFVGFVLPGEAAVLVGGVLAYRHAVSLPGMTAVVVAAAILGDSIGYAVGLRWGTRILTRPVFNRFRHRIDDECDRLRTRGGPAILLARFTAFLRAVAPGLAGASRMPYRTFLMWNAAGGLVWGTTLTTIGYAAGRSFSTLETWTGRAGEGVLAVLAVAVICLAIRRRLARHE